MSWRTGCCLLGLAVLVVAPCGASSVAEPTPAPAAQTDIERLVAAIGEADRGGSRDELPAMAEKLERTMGPDRDSLLLQLVLYSALHPGNERAMGVALLIDFYEFTNDEKTAALVPRLDTRDLRLRDAIYEVLSTVDRPDGGRPDFSPYAETLGEGEDAAGGLIRYLYAVSPRDALAATASVYASKSAANEAVRRVEPVERFRALRESGERVDASQTREAIDALSRDPAWWMRLYAAYLVRLDLDLASPELVERLRGDPHDLVSEAAGR